MDITEFKTSLADATAPQELNELQLALWHAGRGDWKSSHDIAQQYEGQKDFDRLHAYLHRVEGDEWNADYWYRRAGEATPSISCELELEELLKKWI